MRILIFILIIVFLASAQSISSHTVLLLRADRGIVKDASNNVQEWHDQSKNGNYVRQTTSGYRPTFQNNSLLFDGGDDYLMHWDNVNNLFGNFGTSDFTISVRFRHTAANTYDQLVSKGAQLAGYYVFGFWSNGSNISFGTNSTYLTTSTLINTTDYYTVTVVRSGDAGLLYINGDLVFTDASYFTGQNINNTNRRFVVGARDDGASHHFTGFITDVRVDTIAVNGGVIKSYVGWLKQGRPKRLKFAVYSKF